MILSAKTIVGRFAGRIADWCADQCAPTEPEECIVITLQLLEPPKTEPQRALIQLRSRSKRERVSQFMAQNLAIRPESEASYKALFKRYYSDGSAGDDVLKPIEFAKEVRAILDAWGLDYEQSGNDVIVYGAALS